MIFVLQQFPNVQLRLPVNIDDFEVQAILLAFWLRIEKSFNSRVIVYNDNTTTFIELWSQRLKWLFNYQFHQIILIASTIDILVNPKWLDAQANSRLMIFHDLVENELLSYVFYGSNHLLFLFIYSLVQYRLKKPPCQACSLVWPIVRHSSRLSNINLLRQICSALS